MTSRHRLAALMAMAAIFAIAATTAVWLLRGPGAAQFAYLKEPRISRLSAQRMLVVSAAGDPRQVGGKAFKTLFATYYKMDWVARTSRPPAPRARWPIPLDTPRSEWRGDYALPVAGDAALPADVASDPAMRVEVTTWSYGEVAELLHVGSYSSEEADIKRLHAFVASKGYGVVGDHEEEYVKGPGMFFAGNPDAYLTIIRLRIAPSRPIE